MAHKKTKKQRDLFGNLVKEQDFNVRVYSIEEKITASEEPTEFDHDFWEKEAKKFKEMGDVGRELVAYNKLIENSGFFAPYELRKGTLLVDIGEFDEAVKTLKGLYGCESHDTIVAPAQLQMARASAIQGKKDDMIEYLKKAMRTTIFFEGIGTYYGKRELIRDIRHTPEFDKYRDTEEFQEVLNFDWEREDEIELENKIKHYLIEKHLKPDLIDPIRLRLVEYLCKYPESEIYLDFKLGLSWLANKSNSILIFADEMLDYRGLINDRAHYAKFNFLQDKLNSIIDLENNTYNIKDVIYDKVDIETALKISEGPVDVDILERPNALAVRSVGGYFPYTRESEEYRVYTKRRSYDFSVIIFPSSSHSKEYLMEFLKVNGSLKFFEMSKNIKKNYPENLLENSLKKPFDPNRYRNIDPFKSSFNALLDKIKREIDETKSNVKKLKILLEYVQKYFPYLLKDDSIIFSDFVNEVLAEMLKELDIDEIEGLISLPNDLLYILLKSTEVQYKRYTYQRMSYFFELVKDKIAMIDDSYTKLTILMYFDKHGSGGNPNFETMLNQELKTQLVKAEVPIIKTILERKYVKRLSKAERTEIFEQIKLDGLRKRLSSEAMSWNHYLPSRESILLFELLYRFSRYNVQAAKAILNKELEENITRFNGKALKLLLKNNYFSYMTPEQVNTICTNINFEQIFTELNFIRGVQLLERLSKMGYTNASKIIKNQALKLARDKKVNTSTKTFKKYVSDEELTNLFKSHDS